MTREEAIKTLSLHLMQCGALMPIEWVRKNGEGSKLMNAFRMAMDELNEQEERSKGCDFCNVDYAVMNGSRMTMDHKHIGCTAKFCPNCGRDLGRKKDE